MWTIGILLIALLEVIAILKLRLQGSAQITKDPIYLQQ